MTERTSIRIVFCFAVYVGLTSCSRSSGLDLPVKLGNSKAEVYAVLGNPSNQPTDNVQWFQNSGVAIDYDPVGFVSKIVVHGPSNSQFMTFRDPVIYGLKVTDTIERFLEVLSKPSSVEDDPVDTYLESQGARTLAKQTKLYKWRRPPYIIEVLAWTADVTEQNRVFKAGTIKTLEIGKAVGGQ